METQMEKSLPQRAQRSTEELGKENRRDRATSHVIAVIGKQNLTTDGTDRESGHLDIGNRDIGKGVSQSQQICEDER